MPGCQRVPVTPRPARTFLLNLWLCGFGALTSCHLQRLTCLPVLPAAASGRELLADFLRERRQEYQPAFVLVVALVAGVLRLRLELDGVAKPVLTPSSCTFRLLEVKRNDAGEAWDGKEARSAKAAAYEQLPRQAVCISGGCPSTLHCLQIEGGLYEAGMAPPTLGMLALLVLKHCKKAGRECSV